MLVTNISPFSTVFYNKLLFQSHQNPALVRKGLKCLCKFSKNSLVFFSHFQLVAKCTNQLGCGHRYCDNCIRNLHATDGPFRDKTALYYYCGICKNSRTPAPKIVRFDPYGRRIVCIYFV